MFKYMLEGHALFIFTVTLNYIFPFVFKFSYLDMENHQINISPLITTFVRYPKQFFMKNHAIEFLHDQTWFSSKILHFFNINK